MCIGLRYKYALIKGVLYKPIDWNFQPVKILHLIINYYICDYKFFKINKRDNFKTIRIGFENS